MFPSPCDSHHASMVWCLNIYFRMISVPDGTLRDLKWFALWEALAQQQGSAASAIVRDGLQRAPSSQQQPKGSCKFYLRTTLQGSPLTLRMWARADTGYLMPLIVKLIDGRVLTAKHET